MKLIESALLLVRITYSLISPARMTSVSEIDDSGRNRQVQSEPKSLLSALSGVRLLGTGLPHFENRGGIRP